MQNKFRDQTCYCFTPVYNLKSQSRKGFTIVEILVSLLVLGIIASLTIPSLFNKYKEYVTATKVKKFYTIVSQAVLMATSASSTINEWNVSGNAWTNKNAKEFTSYIKPYFKVMKDCGTTSGCIDYSNGIKKLDGTDYPNNFDKDNRFYKIILNDGSYLWIAGPNGGNYCTYTDRTVNNVCGYVYTDINGPQSPNTIGEDIFAVVITTNGVKYHSKQDCKKNSSGWGCINYIIEDNNFNYLK